MRALGIIFCVLFLIMLFEARITINDEPVHNLVQRVLVSIIASAVITLVIGLPVVGIICLIF